MRFRTAHAVLLASVALLAAPIVRSADGPAPVRFEPNRGQAEARWSFVARTPGGEILLGDREARIGALALTFAGAAEGGAWEAVEPLPGPAHYLLGEDPAGWVPDVPAYAGVVRRNLYPGIDAGTWTPVEALINQVVTLLYGDPAQSGVITGSRLLREDHFEFRGASPRPKGWPDGLSRMSDASAAPKDSR